MWWYHLRVILVATQGHIPGYQPMVCGGYHMRVSRFCWLPTQGYTPGYQPRICVVVITWGLSWPYKEFKWLTMFWFRKYRIKLALCKLAQNSTNQTSCSIVFSQQPPNMCHLPVQHCTDPHSLGLHIQMCRLFRWGVISRISILHSNMSACGTWWRWRLIATLFSAVNL
jgi:hypothetical protein